MIKDFKNNFICGRKFQKVSDYILDRTSPVYYSNIRPNIDGLRDGDIIWCYSEYIIHLFNEINRKMAFGLLDKNIRIILITRNSDVAIDEEMFEKKKPICIKKWFAQNVDYVHKDLISMPIGLENDFGPSKGSYTDYNIINKYIENTEINTILNKVYCNFDIKTNVKIRGQVLEVLKRNGIGVLGDRVGYEEYCKNMKKFKFIASPRGNGIDCHRTWEALYLGNYPIVEKHFTYDKYNLPIIQVEDWNSIDVKFLENKYEELKEKKFDFEPMNINYWIDMVSKTRKELMEK